MNRVQLREIARRIWEAALDRVRPLRLIDTAIEVDGSSLAVMGRRYALGPSSRLRLLAIGKAADAFGRAIAARLGSRLTDGLIITKEGHATYPPPARVEVIEAGHPLPDARSVEAGDRIRTFLAGDRPEDLVLLVLTGGASALATLPRPPLTVDDLRELTNLLLRAGATIHELNTVRKHLDLVKGGGLLQLAVPARIEALLLSDVVGDSPSTIASGPVVPDPTTFADALEVLARRGLSDRVPQRVRDVLERGLGGLEPETLKPDDPLAKLATTSILANGKLAIEAAAQCAAELGYTPFIIATDMEGEARDVGRAMAARVCEIATTAKPIAPPAVLLWGGETTVTVRGSGRGGRNQEVALAAARVLDGVEGVCLASIGTDGTDGPTDAAGGIVDGETALRARALGLDLAAALERNDSYSALDALGALIRTGPTGTHVNDLGLALVQKRP